MRLLKVLKNGFSGGQTIYLERKMYGFVPNGQQSILQTLTQLHKMRQYMPFNTPTFSYFVSSIEAHYKKQKQYDRRSLKIYKLMEQMQMMSDTTKKIFHKNICAYLLNEKTQETIKNQKLESLLWWLYRQFPFEQSKFEEVASAYTVRLYDVFEFMNSIQQIPKWQPYIRVSYLLKVLGHELECRTDMFNLQIIEKIDRHFYIYILGLFNPDKYEQLREQMKIHTTLLEFLCEHYIMGDDIEYDKYLQRIEIIDNISSNEEVNKTMDSMSWADMTEAWKLAALAYRHGSLVEMHDYKFTEMFWRKLQTVDIPVQEITRMLRIMIDNPTMFFDKRQAIMMRMVESLYEKNDEQIEFFPANGYKQLLKMPQFLPMDGQSVKKIAKFLYSKIPVLLNWAEGDAEELLQLIQRRQFDEKERVVEFLRKKINQMEST